MVDQNQENPMDLEEALLLIVDRFSKWRFVPVQIDRIWKAYLRKIEHNRKRQAIIDDQQLSDSLFGKKHSSKKPVQSPPLYRIEATPEPIDEWFYSGLPILSSQAFEVSSIVDSIDSKSLSNSIKRQPAIVSVCGQRGASYSEAIVELAKWLAPDLANACKLIQQPNAMEIARRDAERAGESTDQLPPSPLHAIVWLCGELASFDASTIKAWIQVEVSNADKIKQQEIPAKPSLKEESAPHSADANERLWHEAAVKTPSQYRWGPIEGTKKELSQLSTGDADTRCLDRLIGNGTVWGKIHHTRKWSIWFLNEADYNEALKRQGN